MAPVFFAVTMIALGILGLIRGDFPPTWEGVPAALPGRVGVAYLCAVVSLGAGVGLLIRQLAPVAARALVAFFLAWLVVFRIPHVFGAPGSIDAWWGCADTATMAAGVWAVAIRLAGGAVGPREPLILGGRGLRFSRVLYGLAMIPFGIAHFGYLTHTAELVPRWLPWPTGWAVATGVAFLAAGLAVLTGVRARLAAELVTLQLAGFTLLVWVPIVVAGPTAFQWREFVDSWALTAGSWLVAAAYRNPAA